MPRIRPEEAESAVRLRASPLQTARPPRALPPLARADAALGPHRLQEFFAEMKGEERMVCHFFRNNWPCKARRPPPPPC